MDALGDLCDVVVTITRPTLDTKLGIRIVSDREDSPAVIKDIVGLAYYSNLRVDDIITEVNGEVASNGKEVGQLFSKAGTTYRIRVSRSPTTTSVCRNRRHLGLVVDDDNIISELLPGTAIAIHGGFNLGDRVVAVDGTPVRTGDALRSRIPSGNTHFELTTVPAVKPTAAIVDEAAGALPPGAALRPPLSARDSNGVARRPQTLSVAEREELRRAFALLGGGETAGGARIGPTQALAALVHFDPSATLDKARLLCSRHSGDAASQMLDLRGFVEMMHELVETTGPANAIVDGLDPEGLGVITKLDAVKHIRKLAGTTTATSSSSEMQAAASKKPNGDDLACMLEVLQPGGGDGLLERDATLQTLRGVLRS